MADYQRQNQPNHDPPTATTTDRLRTILSEKGPSNSQLLALLTLLPIGAFLLFLAGISFIGTVIGLALSSPLLVIFSPILVPAAAVISFAVAGFLTSGAFGVTAFSSLSWMANNLQKSQVPVQLEQAKQWVRAKAAQSAKEAGQAIQSKAQDGGKTEEVSPAQEGGRTEEVGSAQEGGRAEEGAREGVKAREGETAQEKGTAKDEAAREGVKAREGGKAQGGKARGGGKT